MAPDSGWLVLVGWCAGVFKVGGRDAWIGWAPEQQFRRLRLVANNGLLVLRRDRVPNLASRVPGRSVRRLSGGMQARFDHPVLLAETFVDSRRLLSGGGGGRRWARRGISPGFRAIRYQRLTRLVQKGIFRLRVERVGEQNPWGVLDQPWGR